MGKIFQVLVAGYAVLSICPAHSQDEKVLDSMASGWRSTAAVDYIRSTRETKKELKISSATELLGNPGLTAIQADVERRFSQPGTRSAIMSDGRTVIFEKYIPNKLTAQSTPIGYSISKSLVALTVGKALCDGSIKDLRDPLGKYAKDLASTSWGLASIHDVLRMSSGAFRTNINDLSGFKSAQDQNDHRSIYAGNLSKNYLETMKSLDDRAIPAGAEFHYNNYDTQALVFLVEAATKEKFSKYFEREIWKNVGAEADGAWIKNNQGQVAGFLGFSATTRDWLRVGHFVLDELRKDGCFSDFLKRATTQQMSTNWTYQKSYGYQIWVNCTRKPGSFCFTGFGGQRLIMDPQSQTVLYVHAAVNNVAPEWHSIFEKYQR